MRLAHAALAALLVGGCNSRPAVEQATQPPPGFPVTEGFVTTPDSVRLWYRMVGNGPQTVIIPAALYHRQSFDSLATPARRLILYDSRGRGRSDSVPAAKTGLDRDLADVDAIRQFAGADSVALIAWSGMGMELFTYAVRNPTVVTRIVLLASVGPRWVPYWDEMRANARAKTDSAASARLAVRVKAGEFANDEPGLCRAQAAISNRTGFVDSALARRAPDVCDSPNEWPARYAHYVGLLLETFGKFDLRSDLAKVIAPRLVIHGERDNIPLAGSREWVAGQANARLLVVRGAAHWPHVEQPAITIAAIREFLDGRWPAGSEVIPAQQ